VEEVAFAVNSESPTRRFILGFLNPSLFGAYVMILVLGGTTFAASFFGYGSWFRVGGLLFMVIIPAAAILPLAVVVGGWLQIRIWRQFQKHETNSNLMQLSELIWRVYLVAVLVLFLCVGVGGKLCEVRAKRVCSDCELLIASLEKERELHGTYPTNAAAFVNGNKDLRRKYLFYYGESGTNGVDWSVGQVGKAGISLFVTTNRLECLVPIEKISPISFSSFRVFSYTSDRSTWNRTLLHWSLFGAYVDEPDK
jgi:hypothetical protein